MLTAQCMYTVTWGCDERLTASLPPTALACDNKLVAPGDAIRKQRAKPCTRIRVNPVGLHTVCVSCPLTAAIPAPPAPTSSMTNLTSALVFTLFTFWPPCRNMRVSTSSNASRRVCTRTGPLDRENLTCTRSRGISTCEPQRMMPYLCLIQHLKPVPLRRSACERKKELICGRWRLLLHVHCRRWREGDTDFARQRNSGWVQDSCMRTS